MIRFGFIYSHQARQFPDKKTKTIPAGLLIGLLIGLSIFVLAFLNTGALFADSSDIIRLSPDIQNIKDRGTLIVAMYHKDTFPFYFVDEEGQLTGIDVHLIKGFAELLDVDIVFDRKERTFNELVDAVARHEADLGISKLGFTFARAVKVRYTIPYITLYQGLLINRVELSKQENGRSTIEVIQNLKGKIGVIAKSSYVDNAKQKFKYATVVGYPSWDDVIDAASNGEVVAAYRDEVEIKKIIKNKPDITALHFTTVVLKDAKDPKGIVVPWDSTHLLALLNLYIEKLDLNLTADQVLQDYDNVLQKIKDFSTD